MKDKLDRKIMTKYARIIAKTFRYLIDDGSEDKKAKGTKKRKREGKLKIKNYKNSLEATQLENKIEDQVSEKEVIKCNSIMKRYKNDFDDVRKENIKKHNPSRP